MTADERLLLEERARREISRSKSNVIVRAILAECFDRQQSFILDPATRKGGLCTRRAGKTELVPRYLIIAALLTRALCQFWAISRLRAKQLIWDHLKAIIARHNIPVSINEAELTIKFDAGGEIRLLGADKEKEAHKKRGDKIALAIVDETQLFDSFLRSLVEDVLEPALGDLRGTLCLMGTPGPICAGKWHEVTGGNNIDARWERDEWSVHRWSAWDNPHVQHLRQDWMAMKAKRRWADAHPTWLREYMGCWVNDLGALFYKFDPARNLFVPGASDARGITHPAERWGPGWSHVLGWDLGFRDDMAMVVWAWHDDYPFLYEAHSWKKSEVLSDEILEQIRGLETRGFNFVRKAADTGGGGRLFVEEFCARTGMAFEAASKTEKYAHVRLLNDDLLAGTVMIEQGSPLAEEMAVLGRDLDWEEKHKGEVAPPRENPAQPNHCCDAGLYAFRLAWHYLHEERESKPQPGTNAYWQAEAARMEQRALESVQKLDKENWLDRYNIVDAEWWETE